jgi:hypothetical protein
MFSLARVNFNPPVTLQIRRFNRPRANGQLIPIDAGTERTFSGIDACFRINSLTRTIHAEMPPLPRPVLIYGPDDFEAACADTPEQHAERVLECLGNDPAAALQALCDGAAMSALPVRVPREIPNWRARVILARVGLLSAVETALASLPEPDRFEALCAWNGDAKVARRGKTVLFLASVLNLSSEEIDAIFIQAAHVDR